MTGIPILSLGKISAAKPSDDGLRIIFHTNNESGEEGFFAISYDQTAALIDLISLVRIQCHRLQKIPADMRNAFLVNRWEIGTSPTSGRTIMSLTFGSGGCLDFVVPEAMAQPILGALRTHVGGDISVVAKNSLN